MSKRMITILLIYASVHFSHAEDLETLLKTLDSQNGLPGDYVQHIHQDEYGFLWFAVRGGLARFDGLDFLTWRHSHQDSSSLPSDFVNCVENDLHGNLWLGTQNGLARLDRRHRRIQRLQGDTILSEAWIQSLEFDAYGRLWVGTSDAGLFRLSFPTCNQNPSPDDYTIDHFIRDADDPTSISHNSITKIIAAPDSSCVYIATVLGLNVYGEKSKRFVRLFYDAKTGSFGRQPSTSTSNHITWLEQDTDGVFWLGMKSFGIGRLEIDQEVVRSFKTFPLNLNKYDLVTCLTHDPDDHILWVGTLHGYLLRLDTAQKTSEVVWQNKHKITSGHFAGITHLFIDNSGLLWIATKNSVRYGDPQKRGFHHVGHYPQPPSTLSTHRVTSICETTDGFILVGTISNGIEILDRNYKVVRHFTHNPRDDASVRCNDILSLFQDQHDTIWIGTRRGLDIFYPDSETFEHVPVGRAPNAVFGNTIFSIVEESPGTLWLGTNKGISKIERKDKSLEVQNYLTAKSQHLAKLGGYVGSILPLGGDSLLIGGRGVYVYTPETDRLAPCRHNGLYVDDTMIMFMVKDQLQNYWIGTVRHGLYKLTPDSLIHYTAPDPLPSNFCGGCIVDERGNVWINTHNGLIRYNSLQDNFERFHMPIPLENECRWRSCDTGPSGRLYFGHYYGFVCFKPADLYPDTNVPPLYITDFKVFNKSCFFEKPIMQIDKVDINQGQKMFSIHYAAINFRNNYLNQYKYMLEGFDDRWIEAAGQRIAQYTNIPPGRYTFRVKASNSVGVWNEKNTSLQIVVHPPWWRTIWAYFIWIGLFFGAVSFAYRLQLNRARLKQEVSLKNEQAQKLQELDRLKSGFFANISHELRTPLTLILGPLDSLRNESISDNFKTKLDMMKRNGIRLLQLINQLLDFSKIEAGSIRLEAAEMDLVAFVKRIVASFMSAAERKNISLEFIAEDRALLCYFDADKMDKVLANLLSNAFKFTQEYGRIEVHIRKEETRVYIVVRDTGIGIPEDQLARIFDRFHQVDDSHTRKAEGAGIGLALAREMVELHHGNIAVKSQPGQGSEFTVHLVLGRAHLKDEEIIKSPVKESIFAPTTLEPAAAESPQKTDRRHGKANVLVVEDNRDLRFYIRDLLSNDYNIRQARNGQEGFAVAAEKTPDLIISDVMMPEMDGYELCERIKTDERTSHIPVILLTARADESDKLTGLETGADDYIIKPFSVRELRVRARNLIEQRKKLREKFRSKLDVNPGEVTVTSMDQQFLKRAIDIVEEHLTTPDFSIEILAQKIGLSRMHLFRKIKALTDLSASQFVLVIRLKRAAQLLAEKAGTVTEIAYQVGFDNPSYFSACFRKQFGVRPSQYFSS